MIKRLTQPLTFFIFLMIVCVNAYAQKDMLITQVADSEITRKSYSENGTLESKQHFQVSRLDTVKEKLKVNVKVKLFEEEGSLKDQYITKFTCNPHQSDMLLAIYSFAGKRDASYKIKASSKDFSDLYNFSKNTGKLQPIEITMYFKSGFLGFFGSKNRVRIKNRELNPVGGKFVLTSRLVIKTYMWGVKVNTIHYNLKERFNSGKTLTQQKFEHEDGSYFLIEYDH